MVVEAEQPVEVTLVVAGRFTRPQTIWPQGIRNRAEAGCPINQDAKRFGGKTASVEHAQQHAEELFHTGLRTEFVAICVGVFIAFPRVGGFLFPGMLGRKLLCTMPLWHDVDRA